MKVNSKIVQICILSSCLTAGTSVSARVFHQDAQQPTADNSKANKRDQNAANPTADQQKMNPADRELAKKIRRSVNADKSLSTYAHNIKIISQDGKVTLRGPVRSEDERTAIEGKATEIAGGGNVTNLLEIAPGKP